MNMNTVERLEELLAIKDGEITTLEEELDELRERLELDSSWMAHRTGKETPLPVPRLEIRAIQIDEWKEFEWLYCLVYRHTLGELIEIPFGLTRSSLSINRAPDECVFPHQIDPGIFTPFREGVHIWNDAKQLNLPAFAVVQADRVWSIGSTEDGQCIKLTRLWEYSDRGNKNNDAP